MVSRRKDDIDFNKLQTEVDAAMQAEAKYLRENDAKFRAINQKVATYDEFREIVLASHLKPVDKGDKLENIKFKQSWNQLADTSSSPSGPGDIPTSNHANTAWKKRPRNGHEFGRDWRRVCRTSPDRYTYLLWLGAGTVRDIFRMEISLGVLGDIITALYDEYQSIHCIQVAGILAALTTANRFSLSLDLLSTGEKQRCHQLFDLLSHDLNLANTQGNVEGSSQDVHTKQGHVEGSSQDVNTEQGHVEKSSQDVNTEQGSVEGSSQDVNTEQGHVEGSSQNTESVTTSCPNVAESSLSRDDLETLKGLYGLTS